MHPDYRSVIGLEVHAQLASKSKIYCGDEVAFAGRPNTRVSPISLGHPGTLPQLNRRCVELAIKMGLATHCSIAEQSYFARKNYFYPDLPKGYQISQDKTPICTEGYLEVRYQDKASGTELTKKIRIQRIHIEEDAGKSLHDADPFDTLVDLNRASIGLIEIVTHPDIENAEQAMAYLTEIRKLVRYLEICDGNMEEGSLRCDANVSVMKTTATAFGTRTETKNMNSISNVGRAINSEIERQIEVIEGGGRIHQETRSWDAVGGKTLPMRDKESADDYRYFPEPDLQPLMVDAAMQARIRAEMPELPETLYNRFTQELGLPAFDATMLTEQREFAQFYTGVLAHSGHPRAASNWLNGPVKTYLNDRAVDITEFPLQPKAIASLIDLVEEGKVSLTVARDELFRLLLAEPTAQPEALAKAHNLLLETNVDELQGQIATLLNANADKVQSYLGGKTGLLGFFVGQVMKLSQGKADPKVINDLVTAALEARRA